MTTSPGPHPRSTREDYPRDGLVRWGAQNTIAVRMYDGTGGGGFYKGPIGLYSKASLRVLNGLVSSPATDAEIGLACDTLAKQHAALATNTWPWDSVHDYMLTLDSRFQHSGDDADRRRTEVTAMLNTYRSVTLKDDQTEVVRDAQGHIVVDTIRSWIGTKADGTTETIYPPTRQFLSFDPRTGLELGDQSRFFRRATPRRPRSASRPPRRPERVNERSPVVAEGGGAPSGSRSRS